MSMIVHQAIHHLRNMPQMDCIRNGHSETKWLGVSQLYNRMQAKVCCTAITNMTVVNTTGFSPDFCYRRPMKNNVTMKLQTTSLQLIAGTQMNWKTSRRLKVFFLEEKTV